jgi:hypothetical protein
LPLKVLDLLIVFALAVVVGLVFFVGPCNLLFQVRLLGGLPCSSRTGISDFSKARSWSFSVSSLLMLK